MTCGAFEPGFRRGGPIKSAAHIADTVSEAVNLRMVASDRDEGDLHPYPGLSGKWSQRVRSRVYYLNHRSLIQWRRLFADLRQTEYDLLYVNSFWETTFTLIPVLAVRLRLIRAKQVLLAPRGELAPGALSLKTGKKKAYLKIFGKMLRSIDTVWHASNEMEAEHIRASLPWAKVYVNSDQTNLPAEPISPEPSAHPHLRLIFLSRVSPVKNVEMLLKGLKEVTQRVDLDIYGPIHDSVYWSDCQRIIQSLPSHVRVKYLGEVAPEKVRAIFAQYDAFAFPTRGENFGHVIAESLSASCPVICPDTTPWTSTLQSGGGSVLTEDLQQSITAEVEKRAAATNYERMQARADAGKAYRRWYESTDQVNIIETMRIAGEGRHVPA